MNMNVEEQQKMGTEARDQALKGVDSTMYLGNKLNNKASVRDEIMHQMQQVTITWNRLHVYWKATEASRKWQLLAFDAIIKSELLYGLETAEVGEADLKRIDAFQLRGIRNILGGNTHTGIDQQRMKLCLTWLAELSAKPRGNKEAEARTANRLRGEKAKSEDLRTEEDKRVDCDKWLYKDAYEEMVEQGKIKGHQGNESGLTRSSYWPTQAGLRPEDAAEDEAGATNRGLTTSWEEPNSPNTGAMDAEVMRMLWIKEDTDWNTEQVLGKHCKRVEPFSVTYKARKLKLLGHVIRTGEGDPMRQVTFQDGTIQDKWSTTRRVGRPKHQWTQVTKN
jgi:hypothetical protein